MLLLPIVASPDVKQAQRVLLVKKNCKFFNHRYCNDNGSGTVMYKNCIMQLLSI